MEDCIFCKIISDEIQGLTVGENDQAMAFLDAQPVVKGHTLVVPKVHSATILDLSSNEMHGVFDLVKEVAGLLDTKLKPDAYNIGVNMHKAAGQSVEHLHVHIIPRWKDDGGGSMHTIVSNPPLESLEEIQQLIIS